MVFIPKIEHILMHTLHKQIPVGSLAHRADSASDVISPDKDKNRSSWS